MRTLLQIAASLLLSSMALYVHAGCLRCEPILNIPDAMVASAPGKTLSADQVRNAIVRAGAALGWQIREEGPGMLVGTLVLRTHTAVVEIPYTATNYSIKYRSSVDLNEGDGQIHKNYNGWIKNLAKGINSQLVMV